MANFDSNYYYQIVLESGSSQSLDGSSLYDAGKGATFFTITNETDPEQQWQIFPVNSTYHVLRTIASGSQGYLNAQFSANEATRGKTVPAMRNSTLSDDSMFWAISPWGDGSFYMTNKANGTDWHLEVKSNSLMALTSNITAPATGQQFLFNQLGTIDNTAYSSVVSSTTTAIATSTPTTINSAPTETGNPLVKVVSGGGGLSTGAKAAIGASIGAVAVIVLLLLGFFIMKRRGRNAASTGHPPEYGHDLKSPQSPKIYEADLRNSPQGMEGKDTPMELGGQTYRPGAELDGRLPPAELPAYDGR